MPPSFGTNYILAALLLNPVLFLHSLNTILSRVLPPVVATATAQPPPYSRLGPSGNYPHLDVHSSDSFCWSYTIFMVLAQMLAFGRVSSRRAAGRELKERRKEERRIAHEAEFEGTLKRKPFENLNGNGIRNGSRKELRGTSYFEDGHSSEDTTPPETEDEIMF